MVPKPVCAGTLTGHTEKSDPFRIPASQHDGLQKCVGCNVWVPHGIRPLTEYSIRRHSVNGERLWNDRRSSSTASRVVLKDSAAVNALS
ncbi:hypothetical protein KIN20_037155 [Parelaphostrongylus tenuis]|uniref:Uncharacterized protein n=1 Tax=Parelaphostrongylus tenuis TaxID=148309 RepID=A0AAD5WLV5_PARTN|nr:hypothetical protein KIN20_037155 [Parelaphostrongylus tenuis]